MNYTLNQLFVFSKVVELRSISRASEELFLTQPAVSIQLKNFQDQFDVPLTEVIGKKIHVTDFGMEIYEVVQRILSEVNSIDYKTKLFKGLLTGKLKIGVVSTGKYVMPYFLTGFLSKHEGVDLLMDVSNKASIVKSLSSGDLDFALVSVLPEKLDLNEEVLMDNELYFISNSNFSMEKSKFSKEDLEKHALIFREEGSATRKVMEDYFEKKNLFAKKKIELTSNEAVKQAVLAGLGISIMPLIGIRNELKSRKLKIIPSAGLPIKTKWRIVWLKRKSLSPVAQAYRDYLNQEKSKILKNYFM
jgi:DNA-binding transcriptional LysR family regulator